MKPYSFRTLLLAALCLGGATYIYFRTPAVSDAARSISREAVRTHAGKVVFYNDAAVPLLRLIRPEVLSAAGTESSRFAAAARDSTQFRQLDRKWHFDTLLLAGDTSGYSPLLEHLRSAGDWKLVWLDGSLLIYQRPASKPWQAGDLTSLHETIDRLPRREQPLVLTGIANQLLALQQPDLARKEIDRALGVDAKSQQVWNAMARYHASLHRWQDALTAVDKALAIDGNFIPALATRAEILVATHHFQDAYPISKALRKKQPDDPYFLFLHAKVAHGVKAYAEEIEALDHLISLAEQAGQSASGYRLYLGQAYAADGQAEPALEAFEAALSAGDLSESQREFANDFVTRIKERVPL